MQTLGAIAVNAQILPISAVKPRRDQRRRTGRAVWRNLVDHGDELIRLGKITKETRTAITRYVLFNHITPIEGEAAKRYAYIVARFEKYHVQSRRNAKSPSYEKAFGTDQELERHATNATMDDYLTSAKKAKREYLKLMKAIAPYGAITKSVLDDFCCSDIEPAADFRPNLAIVLRRIAGAFGVTAKPRKRK